MRCFWFFIMAIITPSLEARVPLAGEISHESIQEPENDHEWVHHRTRFYAGFKSESQALEQADLFWGYEVSGFFLHDDALRGQDRDEFRWDNLQLSLFKDIFSLRMGWQTVHWGETLGPSLLDLINPRDLRDPSDWLQSNRKLAVPLLLFAISKDKATFEVWSSPASSQGLLPDFWQGVPVEIVGRKVQHDFGLRLGQRWAGWDLKFQALQHEARIPALVFSLQAFEPMIQASFPRQTSYGLSLSQAWDNIVLRSEVLHARSEEIPVQNLMDFAENQAVVGIDGNWGEHFFWGTELRASQQKSMRPIDEHVQWLIVQGRWNFFDDRLKPLIYLTQRLDARDAYQRYELAHDILPSLKLSANWEAFQSDGKGLFARLEAADRLGLGLRWEF